jgi:hypothetical protein
VKLIEDIYWKAKELMLPDWSLSSLATRNFSWSEFLSPTASTSYGVILKELRMVEGIYEGLSGFESGCNGY